MILADIAFYLFSSLTVFAGVMVISARNPVHSVLYLILAFFNSAGLFMLNGAEFLAMILVIVYVGAVAVLFLFVVMMLDVDLAEIRQGFLKYMPLGAGIGLVLLAELIFVVMSWDGGVAVAPVQNAVTNTEALGLVLYSDYFYLFQIAGLVLLVAMIGAILLTMRVRPGVRRQNIADQNARQAKDVLEVKKVPFGEGV